VAGIVRTITAGSVRKVEITATETSGIRGTIEIALAITTILVIASALVTGR